MSMSAQLKTDPNLERKGVWIELPANDDGSIPEILLARATRSNPDYQKVVERVFRPFRTAQKLNALPAAKNEELTRQAFAEGATLGWKNMLLCEVTGNDGKDGRPLDTGMADFTAENVVKLYERLPELYYNLIEMSVDRQAYLAAEREQDAKNFARSSAIESSKDRQSI